VSDLSSLKAECLGNPSAIRVELTTETLDEALEQIRSAKEVRRKAHRSAPNVLVAMHSLRLPAVQRESLRQRITSAGAKLFEVEPGVDAKREVDSALTFPDSH
jgi:hypothetical protein